MILIKDNGTKFDAIMKAGHLNTDISMQGLKYIKYFLNQYEDELSAKYTYDHKYLKNIITLNFKSPVVRLKPDKCLLSISDFMGRAEAQSAGESQMFAEECQIYTINIHRRHFMMSSLFVYLRRVVDRLPEGKRIRVTLPNKHHKAIVDSWFDSQVVEVITS